MQLRYHGSLLQAAVRYLGVPFGNASDITLREDETADVPVRRTFKFLAHV